VGVGDGVGLGVGVALSLAGGGAGGGGVGVGIGIILPQAVNAESASTITSANVIILFIKFPLCFYLMPIKRYTF
jgi:hypothetical protein